MAVKPNWMRKLEEEYSTRLIKNNQASEIALSHQQILAAAIPELWRKVKQSIQDTINEAEFPGASLSSRAEGANTVMISIFREGEGIQEYFQVILYAQQYKFEVLARDGKTRLSTLFVIVSNGRLGLSNGSESVPPSDIDGLASAICQRLLEPVLRSYFEVNANAEE